MRLNLKVCALLLATIVALATASCTTSTDNFESAHGLPGGTTPPTATPTLPPSPPPKVR
ncbi:MAG: hypothetical protein JO233_10220 [Candidatus Eremiobacteraeota bacterium]|nr:hypothetical protein [Candidatus Eremiobacteraeota bacterium]